MLTPLYNFPVTDIACYFISFSADIQTNIAFFEGCRLIPYVQTVTLLNNSDPGTHPGYDQNCGSKRIRLTWGDQCGFLPTDNEFTV